MYVFRYNASMYDYLVLVFILILFDHMSKKLSKKLSKKTTSTTIGHG